MASIAKRPDGKYRARYRDPAGKEHAKHFDRKVDAQRWLDEATASIVTGQYVSPTAGRMTFREYAESWRADQVHRDSTAERIESALRLHAYPILGDQPLATIANRPSMIQAWVKRLSGDLSPSTVGMVHGVVSGIFKAAIRDRRVPSNPCEGTKLPEVVKHRVVPWTVEMVDAISDAIPARYRALVITDAGTGLRQAEIFGLEVERVDFLRRTLTIDALRGQLVGIRDGKPVIGPPKRKASARTIPLPKVVVQTLAEHLAEFPAGPDGLIFTDDRGQPLRRSAFDDRVWKRALRTSAVCTEHGATVTRGSDDQARCSVRGCRRPPGIPPTRENGQHALRHFYASLLIRHGESVKTVQARLGHASAVETLDTYGHLWPDSDDRTREAVDLVLGDSSAGNPADSLRTAEGGEA